MGRVPLVSVFSLVVRIHVGSEVLAGLDDKRGIAVNFRYEFSSSAGYRGERIIRYVNLEYCVRLPPPFPVWGIQCQCWKLVFLLESYRGGRGCQLFVFWCCIFW